MSVLPRRPSSAVVIGLAILAFNGCCSPPRTPNKYILPEGYVGWVEIVHDVPHARPLPVEDGYLVVRFPGSGVLETSSPLQNGCARDVYYYATDGGLSPIGSTGLWGNTMIRGGYTGASQASGGVKRTYGGFFVGTREQLENLENR